MKKKLCCDGPFKSKLNDELAYPMLNQIRSWQGILDPKLNI